MAWDELWKSLGSYNTPQLLVVLAIVGIIALSMLLRVWLAPGTERLAESSKDRDDAIGILKAENARLVTEKDGVEEENRQLNHQVRNLQTKLAGFEWMKTNPAALRMFADQIENEQKTKSGEKQATSDS